jgi:hypothetical protein
VHTPSRGILCSDLSHFLNQQNQSIEEHPMTMITLTVLIVVAHPPNGTGAPP